ncbi:PREDICTED: uncharacterized protein LOC18586575 [Theobroma cacao]|uniref:Uncharacterized protein LOC18586575 n=1 Tax=Theobroma cacao TaxID=3641 RepID=A0AB32WXC6_THECC|nr:PREDICTED: uncharacterized protein LOC18586575 [Theobroma cacao]
MLGQNHIMKAIFHFEGFDDEKNHAWTITSLKELCLFALPELTHLWKEEYHPIPAFCELRNLKVWDCGKLKILVPSSVLFKNLRTLEILRCHGFVNLIACSTAKSLVQLTSMTISDCVMIEEITACECDEVEGGIAFAQLKCLKLSCLPTLASFNLRNQGLEFPILEKVIVTGCPKMKIFSEGDLSTPMLQRVQFVESEDEACSEDEGDLRTPMLRRVQFVESEDGACSEDEGCWEGNLNTTIQWMLTEKVGYCGLEHIILSEPSELMELWRRNPRETIGFKSVRLLEVYNCSTLRCLFTLSMALELAQLCDMKVKNCIGMEHIIIDGLDKEVVNKIVFPMLTSVILESCADMASFYQGSKILEFLSLKRVNVVGCPQMFAFASTVSKEQRIEATDDGGNTRRLSKGVADKVFFNNTTVFPRLNDLRIGMGNWRKIWDDKVTMNSFCELQFLLVRDCERLSNIFPFYMMERLEKLEILQIMNCDSLEEILGPQGLNSNQSHSVATTELINDKAVTKFVFPKVRSLVLSKLSKLKSFYSKMHTTEWPCLKELEVNECNKLEISEGEYLNIRETQGESQLSTQYFGKVKAFGLMSFRNKSVAISNCFIQSFPHLEKLVVGDAFFNEIFQFEGLGGDEEHAGVLARLSELRLLELPELTHLWKEKIPLGEEVLNNLRILAVLRCGKLKNLMPCSASFKNLTTLEISKRHGFMNLVTLPTAKSMVLLTRMSLTDCQMLERIIASTSDEVMDAIIFSKLESLELDGLPSLSRFCSGNYTFEFPSLKEVIMRRYPKMEIFSKGELSTPKLRGIQSTEGEYVGHWEGNLNATVQKLFIEKVRINFKKFLH